MRQSSGAEKAHKHAETRASSSISSSLKGLVTVAALMTAAMLWLGRSLFHSFSGAQLGILAGLVVGGAIIFGVAFFAGVLLPRWQRDSLQLEEALRRVASGDLSRVEAPELSEYSRGVSDSFAAAVSRVRDEVAELRDMSREQSARAQELSAHCSGFAATSIKLLEQSTTAVHHGQELAEATERARGEVLQLAQAGTLASQDAVALHVRHDEAAELTRDSLTRLDATVELLGSLSGRVEAGSKELSALAAAVAEIRTFVAQVRKMARQSKLLALNAAMEAARAGEQGTGFAVVAGEVRRLASSSTEAAERADAQTSDLVRRSTELLASSESAMTEVRQALEATARGRASLQLLAEGTLARQEDGRSTMDPAALGALVSATLEDVVRGARAALEAMQEVDGGVHAHRDRAQGVAAAGIALGRRSAIEPFNAAKQPGKDRASLARTAASEPRTGAAVEPALSTS